MTSYINHFLFGYYPYICMSVLALGLMYRFRREPYTLQASSSQLLRKKGFNWASNLFHIGVLNLAVGHALGLLVPAQVFHSLGVSDKNHQLIEIAMGSIFGTMTLIGLSMLLYRRISDIRIRRTGSASDLVIALLLWATLIVGLATLPLSWQTHESGGHLHALGAWAQSVVTFQAGASAYIADIPWVFKFHMVTGMTVFLIFPFTRLVHVCSAPFGYLLRGYKQIVRSAGHHSREVEGDSSRQWPAR
jgi:nitrate reductase gamma subunit